MKRFEELTIKDDFMFLTVMSREENLREFLHRLFPERNIEKLIIDREKAMKSAYDSHGICTDLKVTFEDGICIVEMNCNYRIGSLKRGRYYASEVDTELLKKGEDYQELPDVTVVFIIGEDLFHDNICMHTGEVRWEPEGKPSDGDGRKWIYLNINAADYNVNDRLAEVLCYIRDGKNESSDAFIRKLEKDAEEVRMDPQERRAYMKMEERLRNERQLGRDEGLAEGHEIGLAEGKKEGRKTAVCELLLSGAIDMATAVRTSGISEEEMQEYLKKMKS